MSDVTVTPVTLTANTRSIDLPAGGASVTAGQTFAISAGNVTHNLVIVMEEQGGGAAVVTFDAGDNPPAARAGLGNTAISLSTSDLRVVVLESAQHIQDDGTITGTVTLQTVKIYAIRIPKTV